MKKLLLIPAVLMFGTSAMAQDVVRLATEGAYPPTTSSMTRAKWRGWSASWATSCASAPA